MKQTVIFSVLSILAVSFFNAQTTWACACGCGVFDLGTSSMFPSYSGGRAFLEWDYMDQNQDWSGNSKAAAADNPDKEIRTHFLTVGAQYMFDRSWGAEIEVPMANRYYAGTDNFGNPSDSHNALGDIKIRGIYTGFSQDMSSGVTYGLRLPTGDYTYPNFDPDTNIGTGSTDLLLGYYHRGSLGAGTLTNWFARIDLDLPILASNNYFPGMEMDAAFGAYYNGFTFGGNKELAPMLQLVVTDRASDHGENPMADPVDTGYDRLLFAPGLTALFGDFQIFGSVSIPLYQYMNGFQLVAPALYKVVLSYNF